MSIIIAILIFSLLIIIHELGHFLTARAFGVPINEFAIGMGPKLISKVSGKTGIRYSLRLLPIGGFVSMVGEDEESDDVNAFNRKPAWQRLIILSAGALMNLILGLVLMCIISVATSPIGSTTILRFQTDDALSQSTGLMPGDTILEINGTNVYFANDLVYTIMREAVEPVDVTVRRNGEKTVVENVSFPSVTEQGVLFGAADFFVLACERTPGTVFRYAVSQSAWSVRMIWESFIDLITGRYGVEQMSGPVGVTTAIGEAAKSGGIMNVLNLCALITINLGIFNLFPLPALDGGRIVFLVIEWIRGKPLKPEYEGYVHFVGIVLLMLLMVFITYKDIMRLFA